MSNRFGFHPRNRPGALPRVSARLGLAAVVVAVAACGVAEPLVDRLVAIVYEESGVPSVSVPDAVRAGESFPVTVRTVGGDCVRKDETEILVEGSTATVTPYDRYSIPRPGFGCLPSDPVLQHTTDVTFTEAGPARVLVRVRRGDGSGPVGEIEYPVTVEP